jgi:hypothetical protein
MLSFCELVPIDLIDLYPSKGAYASLYILRRTWGTKWVVPHLGLLCHVGGANNVAPTP